MRSGLLHAGSLLIAVFIAACANNDERQYPVTETAKPFHTLSTAKGTAPPVARGVTFERLQNARREPQNWMTYYGAYDGQRYSALDDITSANVAKLEAAWTFQFGQIGLQASAATFAFEAAPIVVDGVMYVSGWDGYLWALDAATGKELWRYKHEIPLDTPACCGNVNRGVAVAKGKVFLATLNGHLVALDAVSGDVAWQKAFADVRAGETATLAPLIVKNLVIVGNSGAEYGVRGHIDAFDIDSGERAWRRYTVPAPGERGAESWPDDDAWTRGGGSAWITASYDPELDLMYWGTGNPAPDFDGSVRSGDNLYTSSVIAIDPDDGAMRWHYQWTPHDLWDYDGNNENILFDRDGRKLLAHFDKNGYLFILDRTNGELVRAVPYANPTWGDIDASSGKVTVKRKPTKDGTVICPGPAGGKEWTHAAYSRQTGLLYAPVIKSCATFTLVPGEFLESLPYWGGTVDTMGHPQTGALKAFDPATGKEVWSWDNDRPMVASVLATAGNLVFTGEPTGEFNAYDARTGELLWQYPTGSGIHSNPVSYSVNGRQYIAVPSGWGGWIKGYAPDLLGAPRGGALFVFALPRDAAASR